MGLAFVIFGPPVLAFVLIVFLPTVRANAIGLMAVLCVAGLLVYSGATSKPNGPDDWYNGIEAMGGILAIYAALSAGTLRGIIDHFRKHRNSLKYAGACGGLLALCLLASAIG